MRGDEAFVEVRTIWGVKKYRYIYSLLIVRELLRNSVSFDGFRTGNQASYTPYFGIKDRIREENPGRLSPIEPRSPLTSEQRRSSVSRQIVFIELIVFSEPESRKI